METDRRKYKRINEENRVIIRFMTEGMDSDNNEEIFAITKDISKDGARLLTDIVFSVGTVFKITVVLSTSKRIVKFDGKVKWVRNLHNGALFEMGVEFMDDIPSSALALMVHVDRAERGISASVIWC